MSPPKSYDSSHLRSLLFLGRFVLAAYRRFETFSSRGRIDRRGFEIAAGRLRNAQPFERTSGKSHENRVFVYAVGLRTGRGFALRENLFLPRWGFGSPVSTRNEG
jgi:hypothetical protein